MSERTLKLAAKPGTCTCPKCAPKKPEAMSVNALGRLKSLATLLKVVTVAPVTPPKAAPKPVETDAQIAARLQAVAWQQLAEMGVPPPPDLNAMIRADRAKEKK